MPSNLQQGDCQLITHVLAVHCYRMPDWRFRGVNQETKTAQIHSQLRRGGPKLFVALVGLVRPIAVLGRIRFESFDELMP